MTPLTETLPTVTFKSVSDLEEGFDRAREDYEQLRSHLQSEEDLDVDYVEDILDRQSERIEQLETARPLREEYEEERPEEYRERVQRLKSLRDETEELLEELMDELEKGMNSVDQNLQVMDRYEQDKGESYYLDETI
jgi:hypothetical protein